MGGRRTQMDGRLGEAVESALLGGSFRENVLWRRQRGEEVLGMRRSLSCERLHCLAGYGGQTGCHFSSFSSSNYQLQGASWHLRNFERTAMR